MQIECFRQVYNLIIFFSIFLQAISTCIYQGRETGMSRSSHW